MPVTLLVRDETLLGQSLNELSLDFLNERITVRELIRERVYEEVREVNAAPQTHTFRTLVQPTEAESTLNGYQFKADKPRKMIQWEEQYERAIEAFGRNGFFILVDDQQVETLDDPIDIRLGMAVSFVKLVPLVGG